jgi:hypothetical protein
MIKPLRDMPSSNRRTNRSSTRITHRCA